LNNPSNAEANNEYSYAFIQSICLYGVDSDSIIVYIFDDMKVASLNGRNI